LGTKKAEITRKNNSGKPEKSNENKSANNNSNSSNNNASSSNSNNNSGKKNDKGQKQKNSRKQQQASRSAPKNACPASWTCCRLTQQECQCQMDNNLCLFCGKGGHKVSECQLKDNSSKACTATTTSANSASKEKKPANLKKE
jgi:hypothetical protein